MATTNYVLFHWEHGTLTISGLVIAILIALFIVPAVIAALTVIRVFLGGKP